MIRRVLLIGMFVAAGSVLLSWRGFTVDDAWIAARYARNLAQTGEAVYNTGEKIMAFTSPLHVAVETVLHAVFGSILNPYKILAAAALFFAALLGLFRLRRDSFGSMIFAAGTLLSPCILMWTMGGLETPLLLLMATAMALIYLGRSAENRYAPFLAAIVTAGAFGLRSDSVIFFAPLLLEIIIFRRRPLSGIAACIVAAAPPIAWLVFALGYFGDFQPTPLYAKALFLPESKLFKNIFYVGAYLLLAQVAPVFIFYLPSIRRRRRSQISAGLGRLIGLGALISFGLLIIYGFLTATVHMMFGFRYFVPYIPAALLLAIGSAAVDQTTRPGRLARAFLLGVIALQVGQIYYFDRHSINGLPPFGEYQSLSIRSYTDDFLPALKQSAAAIRRHWEKQDKSAERPPRIYTFAGGLTPFLLENSYNYEALVSYRHHCYYDLRRSSDYIHLLENNLRSAKIFDMIMGERKDDLSGPPPKPIEEYEVVMKKLIFFNGGLASIYILYDPDPEPNRLPEAIDQPCLSITSR